MRRLRWWLLQLWEDVITERLYRRAFRDESPGRPFRLALHGNMTTYFYDHEIDWFQKVVAWELVRDPSVKFNLSVEVKENGEWVSHSKEDSK